MKKLAVGFVAVCLFSIWFSGCAKKAGISDETSVLYANVKAAEAKDIKGFMDTIHEDSPVRATTEQMINMLFKNFEIKYELSDVKITEKTQDMVKVGYTQVTKKISGPEFRNNKIEGIHYLKKSVDGKWKIFYSEIKKMEFIE